MNRLTLVSFSGTLSSVRLAKLARHLLVCFILLFGRAAYSDDFFWVTNPVDNNWNNPANWSPDSVPGFFDAAHFGASSVTDIDISQGNAVADIFFDPNAKAFTISALPGVSFTISENVVNNSGVEQNFIAESNADDSGSFLFNTGSDGDATITGPVTFTQEARNRETGNAGLVQIMFTGAGDATFHNLGANVAGGIGGFTSFFNRGTSAENCTSINEGATAAGALGGTTQFAVSSPTAANATIVANGGAVSGAGGALISFSNSSQAGNSTLIANGGVNGGAGGTILFRDATDCGTARIEVFGNGNLDLREHNALPPMTIGSLEGDGLVYLSRHSLTIGGNSLGTTFSGVIQGDGSVVKTGTGTLSLTGQNLYGNGTAVTQGVLVVSNTAGSGTGTGPVNVNAGTLGGSGTIAGAVTVGTGSGTGAFLTPGIGSNKQVTLTIQSALTFNSDATCTYTFKGNRNRVRTDLVIANGVTINGATIAISSSSQNRIRRGTVLMVISNTSVSPISGAFSNPPDGAIVNVNGNNLQASYSGGDGNDLTLTVVP